MSYRVVEEEAASNCAVAEETPFCTVMYSSMDYSDYMVRNHLIPPLLASSSSLQETLINFTNEQRSSFAAAYPFDCPISTVDSNSCLANCPIDTTNYSCGALPFDPSFNKFMAAPQHQTENYQWIIGEQEINSGNFNSELCLSLAAAQEHCSDITSSSHSFRKPKTITDHTSSNSNAMNNPSKPLQLSCSAFMHAMQKILAEIACFSLENPDLQNKFSTAQDIVNPSSSTIDHNTMEIEAKKKHLLALLQLVDNQYNQCLDEVHTVISAFHAVTDLDPNLHTRFALPAISNMYKNLRERISSHILELGSHQIEKQKEENNYSSFGTSSSTMMQKQWAIQHMNKRDKLWKPQRGLPERSLSVLKAWMFQNFLHPYPKDAEKHLLALKSGLTRSQVSNWFINARVRLWKPMIEEMYAEMSTRKPRRSNAETDGNATGERGSRINNHFPLNNTRFSNH